LLKKIGALNQWLKAEFNDKFKLYDLDDGVGIIDFYES
jgi:hypothetical protein